MTLVPDRRRDGTNVVAVPVAADLPATYGRGSFARHLDGGVGDRACAVEVRRDARLAIDVDNPDDLAHPALSTTLPAWLRTILASRR